MTHTTLRPYTKAVVISALGTSAIELRDTSDTLLECNYIRVNTYGTPITTAIPDFIVFLSGVDGLTTPSVSPATVTPTASGFCGVAGQAEGVSPVEIFLDDQDKVSEIQIFNAAADSITYVITYGNIRFINPMRFNDRPKGS
jgi:hypothetical protein